MNLNLVSYVKWWTSIEGVGAQGDKDSILIWKRGSVRWLDKTMY